MLNMICNHCGKALEIPEKFLGTKGKCNHCGGSIIVEVTPAAASNRDTKSPKILKKAVFAMLGVIVVVAVALLFPSVQSARDDLNWRSAVSNNDVSDYKNYLQSWPEGKHIAEAKKNIESIPWQEAAAANTVRGYTRYIDVHRDGKHAAEAKDRLDSLLWQESMAVGNLKAFERYLKSHVDGKHSPEALEKIHSIRWQEALAVNTVQGFEHYLKLYSEGEYKAEAEYAIENLRWQEVARANTIRKFTDYIASSPQGRFAQEASEKITALRSDDTSFNKALQKGTEGSLEQFIVDFPSHDREAEVQKFITNLKEGQHIVELLEEKKIEIEAQGQGIEFVNVRLRKVVPYPLKVLIPAGSYFVSARQSAQNMVTTAKKISRLDDGGWRTLSIPAACANRPRSIPGRGDSFTVQKSPNQEALTRLMPVLERENVPFAVRQAAVWIVTDNADFADLGILVRQFGGRIIGKEEAARAMKICDEAGVDIANKRIWVERKAIMGSVQDADVKAWFEQKDS